MILLEFCWLLLRCSFIDVWVALKLGFIMLWSDLCSVIWG